MDIKYYPEEISEDQMYAYTSELISNGTEVIYTLNKNNGLYKAAKEHNIPVIGFDYNYSQEIDYPEMIIMYIEKDIQNAMYLSIQDYFNGLYKGQVKKYSLSDDCLHLITLNEKIVSPDIQNQVEAWIDEIIDSDIKIPSTREELQNYAPPHLSTEQSENESKEETEIP